MKFSVVSRTFYLNFSSLFICGMSHNGCQDRKFTYFFIHIAPLWNNTGPNLEDFLEKGWITPPFPSKIITF